MQRGSQFKNFLKSFNKSTYEHELNMNSTRHVCVCVSVCLMGVSDIGRIIHQYTHIYVYIYIYIYIRVLSLCSSDAEIGLGCSVMRM